VTYFLLPFTFQLVLQSAIVALLSLPLWRRPSFREGILVVEWREWWDRRWNYTTCISYVMGISQWNTHTESTWFHETNVHVKQFEDLAVLSDIIALGVYFATGSWVTALVIWFTGGPLWLLPNYLTALRFRKAGKALKWSIGNTMYMMSEHERSAYAQTEQFIRNGGAR
jgi:hypothetical protein